MTAEVDCFCPDESAPARALEAASMVLHELATNAAKHGALSTGDGRVCVRWHRVLNGDADGPLRVEWQESGGPAIQVPDRSGYGMEVIRGLLPHELDGKVDLVFAAEGVRRSAPRFSSGLTATSADHRY